MPSVADWHLKGTCGQWNDFPQGALQVPCSKDGLSDIAQIDESDYIFKVDVWNTVALFGGSHLPTPLKTDIFEQPSKGIPPRDGVGCHPMVDSNKSSDLSLEKLKALPALTSLKAAMAPIGLGASIIFNTQ